MAEVPVFIDADASTRVERMRPTPGDLLVIYVPAAATEAEVKQSVAGVQRALEMLGVRDKVSVVFTMDTGWSLAHYDDRMLAEYGLRKI